MSCCAPTTTGGSTDGGDCACTYINVGDGVDPYVPGTVDPAQFRRHNVINDGTDLHGTGNLAWWADGQTLRVDLPRANDQNFDGLNVAGTLTTLWEHTYASDAAGANVAGRDGEDWWAVWSLKICGDPGQPLTDATARLESHKAGSWQLEDAIHGRPVTGLTPSWPMTRPFLLTNTDWSSNGGLRLRITVATSHFAVTNLFEHPSVHIYRENRVPAAPRGLRTPPRTPRPLASGSGSTETRFNIATTFPRGLNHTDLMTRIATRLRALGLRSDDLRAFLRGTRVHAKIDRGPQHFSKGELVLVTAREPTVPERAAIDQAITDEPGHTFSGLTLAALEAGEFEGQQLYVVDLPRKGPSRGLGTYIYWDGLDSWRRTSDDTRAKTFLSNPGPSTGP